MCFELELNRVRQELPMADPAEQCPICLSASSDPFATDCCGQRFCGCCISLLLHTNRLSSTLKHGCPLCRKPISTLVGCRPPDREGTKETIVRAKKGSQTYHVPIRHDECINGRFSALFGVPLDRLGIVMRGGHKLPTSTPLLIHDVATMAGTPVADCFNNYVIKVMGTPIAAAAARGGSGGINPDHHGRYLGGLTAATGWARSVCSCRAVGAGAMWVLGALLNILSMLWLFVRSFGPATHPVLEDVERRRRQ